MHITVILFFQQDCVLNWFTYLSIWKISSKSFQGLTNKRCYSRYCYWTSSGLHALKFIYITDRSQKGTINVEQGVCELLVQNSESVSLAISPFLNLCYKALPNWRNSPLYFIYQAAWSAKLLPSTYHKYSRDDV